MPRITAAPAIRVFQPLPTPLPQSKQDPRPEQPAPGCLWIPASEAAAQLGLTIEALKARAKQGLLGFKEGGRWRFSSSDLKRYTETVEKRHLRSFPRR